MPAKDWVGLIIQALLLGGLIWYCIETRWIRIASNAQLEALRTPCLTFVATPRDETDAVLDADGAVGAMILQFYEGSAMLINIGNGPAVNIEYLLTPIGVALSRPQGYISNIPPGVRANVPIPRGILHGHSYECSIQYDSLSHTRYETKLVVNNLVLTPPFRFGKAGR